MKSSIKVAYASKWEQGLGEKEPVVRVEVFNDDTDPRDSLLKYIFTPTTKLDITVSTEENPNPSQVYILSVKNRYSQVCDMLETVFAALSLTQPEPEELTMCTANIEIYFERVNAGTKKKRSKGLNRDEINSLPNYEIIKLAVADFKDFLKVK